MIILLIWLVVLVAVVILYFRQIYSKFEKDGIRHLKPIPLLGNMGNMMLRKHHIADDILELYRAFPEDRFVGRYEFLKGELMLRDVGLVKKIAVKDFEHFLDHRSMFEDSDSYFARTLVALKGQEWKDMRSTLSPLFTSSKIRLMVPFMVEVGSQMMSDIMQQINSSNEGYIDVDCKDLTTRYATDVIATCVFGVKVNSLKDKDNEFYMMGKETSDFNFAKVLRFFLVINLPKVAESMIILLIWLVVLVAVVILYFRPKKPTRAKSRTDTRPVRDFARLFNMDFMTIETKDFYKNLVIGTMKERELRQIFRPDMIHLLMEARKGKLSHDNVSSKDKTAGFSTVEESTVGTKEVTREWSDNDLISQAVLFFIAGFDTVSTAMSFLLYELALNPDVQEKLAQEIKDHDTENDGKFDLNSIQSLNYLDMVISEILRKWPPALALDRLCKKDYNMGRPNNTASKDYIVREGTALMIPVYAFHHDPQYFTNPEKFDPERFSAENQHKINPLAYMPFGAGPRNCIGSRFALCEVKVMIYQMLLHIEVSPCEKTCIPAELATDSFNIKLKGGHWLRFKARN